MENIALTYANNILGFENNWVLMVPQTPDPKYTVTDSYYPRLYLATTADSSVKLTFDKDARFITNVSTLVQSINIPINSVSYQCKIKPGVETNRMIVTDFVKIKSYNFSSNRVPQTLGLWAFNDSFFKSHSTNLGNLEAGSSITSFNTENFPINLTGCTINPGNCYGSINNLPYKLRRIYTTYLNEGTLTGSINYCPSSLQEVDFYHTELTGDISTLAKMIGIPGSQPGIRWFNVGCDREPEFDVSVGGYKVHSRFTVNEDYNTITGDIKYLPKQTLTGYSTELNVAGYNTITGDVSSFSKFTSTNRVYCAILGYNDISGNIVDSYKCDGGMMMIEGNNTISGNISNITNTWTHFWFKGKNTITGDVSILASKMLSAVFLPCVVIHGNNTVYGDIGQLLERVDLNICIAAHNTLTYTKGRDHKFKILIIDPSPGYGLTSTDVDNILIDASLSTTFPESRTIWLKGNNAPRTSASDPAYNYLIAKGSGKGNCNVYTN